MAPQLTATNGRWRRGLAVVDGAGGELLAGARFAEDQHAGIVGRDLADQAGRFAHRRRRAGRHGHVAGLFERRFDRHAQGGGQHRVLEGEMQALQPGAEGGEQLVGNRGGAVGDDRDVGELLTQSSTELAPIAIGYVADEQGRRRARRLDDCPHQGAVIDQQRLEPEGTQDFGHPLRALRIAVIDDRPLQSEGSQSCRVAQVHPDPCAACASAFVLAAFCLSV